ncbi:MAG TPA: hypothetical protein VGM86_04620 [Thermoanaerobaculia bacterium]
MKKRAKKLTLSRETLHNLGRMSLAQAVGGANTHEFQTGCACTVGCGTNSCGCGTGSCGCGTNTCTIGNTHEIDSGCATNC